MNFDTPIENVFRLQMRQKKALEKIKIYTLGNLLYHFPSRYETAGNIKKISELKAGDSATIYGTINALKTKKAFRKKIAFAEGTLSDETGKLKIIWFSQPYIAKTFKDGSYVKIRGSVSQKASSITMTNPEIEIADTQFPDNSLFINFKKESPNSLLPIYPETRGISSRWFYHASLRALQSIPKENFKDAIPVSILKKYNLPTLYTALFWIHNPESNRDAHVARKRFSFEEIFFIQLNRQRIKHDYKQLPAFKVNPNTELISKFTKNFGFNLTNAQNKTINTILKDISSDIPMLRLLEGDVGSGKTAVAATASFATIKTKPHNKSVGTLQVAYMTPTEVLAKQQFENFITLFKGLPIQIGLITGSGCRKFPSKISPTGHTDISRNQLLKWVNNGEIAILVGTHALIQDKVKFKDLALVIIDEQHRFGVLQRKKLGQKNLSNESTQPAPHLLSMTATPIPRTLALTIYGDLDISLLDEMPKGRMQVKTYLIPPKKRQETYEFVIKELTNKRQCYVICPRIEEPDESKAGSLRVKSAKKEAERLQKEIFPKYKVGLIHGKMKPNEKDLVMKAFSNKEIDILVATSVIEVGVNIPNATTIIIEGAQRFGLAQLHQLRGRVLRSNHQAHCFLFTDSTNNKTLERLKALTHAKNGFELAEIDLTLRGEGSLTGGKQWGLSDVGMEAIKNIKMVEAAREEAQNIIKKDPDLKKHESLKRRVEENEVIHME